MHEPEYLFDMTEERYQSLAKTHKVLTYTLWFLGYLLFEAFVLAVLSIGGLK